MNSFRRKLLLMVAYISWLKSLQAVDPNAQVLHFYQTTKYTMANQWTQQETSTSRELEPVSLLVSAADPAWIDKPKTMAGGQFRNKLKVDSEAELKAAAMLAPNNPAPMLIPNPFINNAGMQLQFSPQNGGKSGGGGGGGGGGVGGGGGFSKFNALPRRREEGSFCRRSFDGRSGYCILAYQCLHVIREYRVHGTKIDVCTYRKSIPVICCPLADKHLDEQRISAKKCREYHDAVRDIKVGLPRTFSGKQCVPSVPMIVGGAITRTGEYPHMAALGWTQNADEIKWGCGGTLISELFVLTAAHCITSGGKPPDMVRLGAQNLNRTAREQRDIKILIIILHPKYRSSSYYHDIALLKLTKRVTFNQRVRPACLWQLPDMEIPTGIAAGWGRTEFLGTNSDDLQKVDLNLIDQKLCKDFYRKERRLPRGIIDQQFCAGHLEGGKDTCQGDSGGPLHAELPEYNCVKFILGVTSFGKFCAAPNSPGVYTKVYSYLDWIEKIAFRN